MSAQTIPVSGAFQLSLIITEKCNLSCDYCFCDKSMNRSMSPETARSLIGRTLAEHSTENGILNILLMGGEPFLEFPLIRDLVKWARETLAHHRIRFKAVTNGTLVHGKIQDWLLSNSDLFSVELSLDGIGEDHNSYRSGSFDQIDFDFFRNRLADPVVSTVVSPATLDRMAGNIISLAEAGFRIKCVLADGVDWASREPANRLSQQLLKLIDFYLNSPELYPFNLLSMATWAVNDPGAVTACRPGHNSVAADTQGNILACHRCSSYYNTGTWKIPAEYIGLQQAQYLSEACSSCCIRHLCHSCPASVASLRKDPEQSRASCLMSKALFTANAYFHLRLLTEIPDHIFLRHRSQSQKKAMLAGSKFILDNLNPDVPF